MESSLLEIIELANGDIVLRRAETGDEPLVNIRFGKEALALTADMRIMIAKAMMQAGIEAFNDLSDNSELISEEYDYESHNADKAILH